MGKLVRFSVLDIRDRMASEARREELEAQLRQSQKLEAVGQLTGGVAHDFNNLLTVILGNMDLLKEIRENDPEVLELAESAIGAAERSAVLTQRLLAFSRRQALHTKTIDLPVLVDGLLNLLMRSLGERVRVHADFPADLWPVSADPGHLEHTLINLAVNARDAMPRGGELYLEAHNVVLEPDIAPGWGGESGDYVCVSVTDTGVGMAPEVMDRAVDPFFTTKEIGAGSGLGLSMVYGFAKQSGGFLQIHSAEGTGTSIQLFLPRATEGDLLQEAGKGEVVPRGAGEVVLVVEDEPLLLEWV
jgi:signal transduction histidine kinase